MPTRLTGMRPMAYMGVNAGSPPNMVSNDRDPNGNDYYGFFVGDYWMNVGTTAIPLQRLWVLANKRQHIATWVLIINGAGGPIVGLQGQNIGVNAGAVVNPTLGIVNINNSVDGNLVFTHIGATNTLNLNFANSITINLDITSTGGTIRALNGALYGFIRGNFASLILSNQNNVNQQTLVNLVRYRDAAAKVEPGDNISSINSWGWDGVVIRNGSIIDTIVDGATAAGAIPCTIRFHTGRTEATIVPRMTIDSYGRVNINTTNIDPNLQLLNTRVNPIGPTLWFSKNNGGAAVGIGDELLRIGAFGHDGTNNRESAYIISIVDSAVANLQVPSALVFRTGINVAGISNRMTINSNGNVVIDTPTVAGTTHALQVHGSVAVSGDSGAHVDGSVAFTNVLGGLGGAACTVLGRLGGAPGNNTDWIKIYVNGAIAYIPYWVNP